MSVYQRNIRGFLFVMLHLLFYSFFLFILFSKASAIRGKGSSAPLLTCRLISVYIEVFLNLVCIVLSACTLLKSDFLLFFMNLKLAPFAIAAIYDVGATAGFYAYTKATCPVAFFWILYLSFFVGLKKVHTLRPYRILNLPSVFK